MKKNKDIIIIILFIIVFTTIYIYHYKINLKKEIAKKISVSSIIEKKSDTEILEVKEGEIKPAKKEIIKKKEKKKIKEEEIIEEERIPEEGKEKVEEKIEEKVEKEQKTEEKVVEKGEEKIEEEQKEEEKEYIEKEEEKEQIPEITKIQAERIIIKQSELNLPEFINPFYENILIELLIKINPEGKVEKINFIKSSKIISLDKAVYNFVSKLIFNKDTEIAYKLLKINIKYD